MRLVMPCDCEGPRRIPGRVLVNRFRVSRAGKGATADELRKNRNAIRADMVRNRRYLMVEGQRAMAKLMTSYLTQKLEEICDRVEERLRAPKTVTPAPYGYCPQCGAAGVRRSRGGANAMDTCARGHVYLSSTSSTIAGKNIDDVSFGSNESIVRNVLEELLGAQASLELIADYQPLIQSIAARANARTAEVLGQEIAPQVANNILKRSYNLAREVTVINDTTRNRLIQQLEKALADGQTIGETIKAIRDTIPEIVASRVPTIARTEVGRAIDEGTKEAVKSSTTVATMDVIGCQAVEPNIPTFDGRPTCNIVGVPANRIDELQFHINHTGAIVVGTFKD